MHDLTRRSFLSAVGGVAAATALAGCGSGTPAPAQDAASGAWEFTDDLGRKVSLTRRPQRVVAYVSGAAALWDFGVRPVGVYGPSRNDDGTKNLLAGNIDLAAVTSVGDDYTAVNLEQLAALKPDLMLASLNGPTGESRWVIKDDLTKIEQICPVYSIQESLKPLPDVIESYTTLAERLGANTTDPAIATARDAFTAAGDALQAALAEKPGLRCEFTNADTDALYVASPKFYATLLWYTQLGMTIIRQDDPSSDFYQQLSWEQAGMYPADLILTDIRSFSLPQKQMIAQYPTFANLPAVQAGQLGGWNGEPRFSYQQAVSEVQELTAAVQRSKLGVGG